VIQAPGYLSSVALAPAGRRSDYITSAAHYEVVARDIVAALRGGTRPFVLVTGDPPANSQLLSEALGNVGGRDHAVIILPGGPKLRVEDLERADPTLAGRTPTSISAAPTSLLFVFDDFGRLSDRQIEKVCADITHRNYPQRKAVLLATLDFLVRLERPALQFLKERIAAQFRFEEVGDDEAIAFLHDQLLVQRDRQVEARAFRRGIMVGLAAGGIVLAASTSLIILYPTAERVSEVPAGTGRTKSVSQDVAMLRPADEPAAGTASTQIDRNADIPSLSTAPPSLSAPPSLPTKVEDLPPAAPSVKNAPVEHPPVENPPGGPRLSAAEITGLLARGDGFLGAGDITSARLFYERAAEAESGAAAFQLGETFDPLFANRARLHSPTADPAKALFWYRRARELGVTEAEQRIKALEARRPAEIDARPR
jgi:hypothetical protein